LKLERESTNICQIEDILKIKIFRIQTETTEASFTNRIQEMEKRMSSIEDIIEEIDTLIKETVKSKQTLDTKHPEKKKKKTNKPNNSICRGKRRNRDQWPRNHIQENHRRKFSNLKKISLKVQEAYKTPKRLH
jgi:hypothetical protein